MSRRSNSSRRVGRITLVTGEIIHITRHCVLRWQERSTRGITFNDALASLIEAAIKHGRWIEQPAWVLSTHENTRWLRIPPDIVLIVQVGRYDLVAKTCVYPGIGLKNHPNAPRRVRRSRGVQGRRQ